MVRCCTCGPSNGGTCTNCVCVSSGVPCSGCPNLKLGKCKNPHAPSQGPQAPVLPRKKGRVLGRPAPAATNLPDPPPPLRFGPLRLGPPEPSPAELARASEEGGAASYVSFLQSSSSSSLSSSVSSFSSTSSGLPASTPSPAPIPFDSPPLFSMVEADFDLLTRLNSPTLRLIPRRALGQFARVWGALLLKAVATATHENWFSALAPGVF